MAVGLAAGIFGSGSARRPYVHQSNISDSHTKKGPGRRHKQGKSTAKVEVRASAGTLGIKAVSGGKYGENVRRALNRLAHQRRPQKAGV